MDKTTRWMMDEHLQTETYRPFVVFREKKYGRIK